MPAFGCNQYTIPFALAVFNKEKVVSGTGTPEDPYVYAKIGFRLSDRIVSALDRLLSDLIAGFSSSTYPVLKRWAFIYPFVGACDWSHAMNLADNEGGYKKYEITWASGVQHTENGIQGGSGYNNTNADCGRTDAANVENWAHKSFGFYSRTNSAVSEQVMVASTPVQPNGFTYYQAIYPRYGDGNAYFDNPLVSGYSQHNRVQGPCGQSHGLFVDSKQMTPDHRGFLNGTQFWATDTGAAHGMGYGSSTAWMYINCINRQLAFVFSTKHSYSFSPAENVTFYEVVQRFQRGMNRAV